MKFRGHARRVRKEAAWWHMRMLEPRNEAEVDAFEAWLAQHPAHAQEYAAVSLAREAAGRVDLSERRPAPATPAPRALRPAFVLLLAMLALATMIIALQGGGTPAFAKVVNDGPAVRGVRLEDTTVVWLDIGSELGVRFTRDLREIAVRRGRLRILPGRDSRPLEVTAGDLRVRPGSTAIDVTAGDEVIVGALDGPASIEGIATSGEDQIRQIGANRALAVGASGVRDAQVERTWPSARLQFANEPLSRITTLANQAADPDILIPDPKVADLRVSGVFDLRDSESPARKLAAAHDLELVRTPSGIELRRRQVATGAHR